MKRLLQYIASEMKVIGVTYHLLQNRSKKAMYPYFVGEIFPIEPVNEDGKFEYTFLLTGFDRSEDITALLEDSEKIINKFPPIEGLTTTIENQCIAVFSSEPELIASGEENLQKLQINLSIKMWKGQTCQNYLV